MNVGQYGPIEALAVLGKRLAKLGLELLPAD